MAYLNLQRADAKEWCSWWHIVHHDKEPLFVFLAMQKLYMHAKKKEGYIPMTLSYSNLINDVRERSYDYTLQDIITDCANIMQVSVCENLGLMSYRLGKAYHHPRSKYFNANEEEL